MPPALYPRSIQVARLLKGLDDLGYRTTVVTPRLADLPETDLMDHMLRNLYAGYYTLMPVDLSQRDLEPGNSWKFWWRRMTMRDLDDDEIWAERAAMATKAAAVADGCDALITFAQPWRDHLAGLALRRWRKKTPWIAHFSDPWVDSPYTADLPPAIHKTEQQREAAVIRQADVVVFTNEYAADLVMRKYPARYRRKSRVVPHAMDTDLIGLIGPPRASRKPGSPLRLIYVGQLFRGRRTPDTLFEALSSIHKQVPLDGRVEVEFVGEGSGRAEAQAQAKAFGLDRVVRFRMRVPYLESLEAMAGADVLVLIDAPADINVFLPSKLADYLMVGKPVLAITPVVGPSADMVRAFGYPVVSPGDQKALVGALRNLMDDKSSSPMIPLQHRLEARRLDVRAVAAMFGDVIEQAIEKKKSGKMAL